MKVQMKIQIQTQIQIQADEKSWRWPQSGNELNEPAGEQWRPLGADLATGFASTIARIKIHKQIQNTFVKKIRIKIHKQIQSKYKNKYKILLRRICFKIRKQIQNTFAKKIRIKIHQQIKI